MNWFVELYSKYLNKETFELLKSIQPIFYILFAVGGAALAYIIRKWKRSEVLRGVSLDWLVIGAGAATVDGKHLIRTFAEKPAASVLGEHYADELANLAKATIKKEGTQILFIADEKLRNLIRPRATTLLNEFAKPEVVARLAGKNGWSNFVVAFTVSDYRDSQKIRLSIRAKDTEVNLYKPGSPLAKAADSNSLESVLAFGRSYHSHDALLTAEIARVWAENPTNTNQWCWEVELYGRA